MPKRSSKRPRDANQLAKTVVDLATGATHNDNSFEGKDPAAVALGRKGGLKGGKARAESLTKSQRLKIAKKAAKARWSQAAVRTKSK
jgi:hypothetical protein